MARANDQGVWFRRRPERLRLSPNVAVLGVVSLLMGMSSAMIYGLLSVFLVTVVGAGAASVGLIEGIAEATTSLIKIFLVGDRYRRHLFAGALQPGIPGAQDA